MGKRIVIALGGNAILQKGQDGTFEVQLNNVYKACKQVAKLIDQGHEVVITHGNGPQVGAILLQNEEAADVIPPMPLFVCGAESQGLIGLMVQQAMGNILQEYGSTKPVVTLITQVVVAEDDPAFTDPAKPIGTYYSADKAEILREEKGWTLKEDKGRGGWRRVVPSPNPIAINEKEALLTLLKSGAVVIASGGGGIPVVRTANGLQGVDAVIDKDLAGQRMARDINADIFCVLTDVEQVALNFRTPEQQNLLEVTTAQAREYANEGHFAAGSMGPKVEAAVRFVENGGDKAVITSLESITLALAGTTGTTIIK